MSGQLLSSYREGNRSEYLAQYLMSAIGLCAPVLRQEDIGIDFYCSIAERANRVLTFHSPFGLQVKSDSDPLTFGGTDDKGNWKAAEIAWLQSQELPLLIGVVSKKTHSMRLHSTQMLAHVFAQSLVPGQVNLVPDAERDSSANVPHAAGSAQAELPEEHGDRRVWEVPLGPPVAVVDLASVEDEEERSKIRHSLTASVRLDAANLKYRGLHCRFNQWWLEVEANAMHTGKQLAFQYSWSQGSASDLERMLAGGVPFMISLANHLKALGRGQELLGLRGYFALVPRRLIPDVVREKLPELFA